MITTIKMRLTGAEMERIFDNDKEGIILNFQALDVPHVTPDKKYNFEIVVNHNENVKAITIIKKLKRMKTLSIFLNGFFSGFILLCFWLQFTQEYDILQRFALGYLMGVCGFCLYINRIIK